MATRAKKGRPPARRRAPETPPEEDTGGVLGPRALLPWVIGVGLAFAALVAIDQFALHIPVLTTFDDNPPLSPLYAFWMPELNASAVLFLVSALAFGALVPRLLAKRTSDTWFGVALLAFSIALPLALFLARENAGRLGSQFLIYRGEEYFDDALGVRDLAGFLRGYTTLAPQLSLHGRVHPPGFAALLVVVSRLVGPSPFAAGVAVLLIFSAGIVLAWRAAVAIGLDRRAARIAALLLLAAPSLLDFACTSMDAVFFTAACLALLGAFRALAEAGRWWHAALAGAAFYLAAFCSFSALPLGLFVVVYAVARWWDRPNARVAWQLGGMLAGFALAYVAFRLATGFDLWESFVVARGLHYQIMGSVIGRSVGSVYVLATFGNISAWLIGAGLAVVPLFARSAVRGFAAGQTRPLFVATAVTSAVMCAGGIYTMETERILMFAVPWLAMSAAGALKPSDSAVTLAVGAGWVQAIAMEVMLFTLW
jgi:hypothetical protein